MIIPPWSGKSVENSVKYISFKPAVRLMPLTVKPSGFAVTSGVVETVVYNPVTLETTAYLSGDTVLNNVCVINATDLLLSENGDGASVEEACTVIFENENTAESVFVQNVEFYNGLSERIYFLENESSVKAHIKVVNKGGRNIEKCCVSVKKNGEEIRRFYISMGKDEQKDISISLCEKIEQNDTVSVSVKE